MNRHIIWVRTKCDNYYRFIGKLQYLNLNVLDIKYIDNQVYLKIDNEDYQKLEKYLVSYKFYKVKDLGIYAIINKLKSNHIFLITVILGLCFYFVLTNVIVKINVVHENKEIRELIKEELEERGVKILTFKKSYATLDKIKQEILDKYPDRLDWIEIENHGMVYDVKVEERIITDIKNEDKICNLVATKNGTISNIKLYDGEVKVDLNDYVRKGDILISGKVYLNDTEEKRKVCAKGEVYATVWYTVNVKIPFNHEEENRTGKMKYNLVWDYKENPKRILKDRFSSYESVYRILLKAFDFSLYLEREYETEKITKTYSEDEALEAALKKAEDNILMKLSDKDKIIDKKVLKKDINDSTMDVEVFVIAEELISEEQIITDEEEQGVEDR